MEQIKVIEEIIKNYSNKNLDEANTRFKIIDDIIVKILNWPKEQQIVEFKVEGGKGDYVLYGKNKLPALVIEAKKSGSSFTLPAHLKEDKVFRKIKIAELMSVRQIKEALIQVKEYCEEIGCNYACASNGKVWIVFQINPQNKPWKSLFACVITDLKYFKLSYTDAVNLLGYNAIVNLNSLRANIGVIKSIPSEIYYAKDSIYAYNTSVANNPYAKSMSLIGRKFFGNIPFKDNEFMKRCYVTDKQYSIALQENIQSFIYEALTPYFKTLGFKEIDSDKNGGEFGLKIQEIVKKENLDSVMILFGSRGSGKSTFIERLFYYVKPEEVVKYANFYVIDLISSTQDPAELPGEIWKRVVECIDSDKLLESDREKLLKLFEDRFVIYERQFLFGLNEDTQEYRALVNKFILECKDDVKYCSQRISLYWKNQKKGLILVLDNMDQLPEKLQDTCFLTANEISKKLVCLVIISMREERFYNVSSRGVLDAYHTNGFHISSPIITDVASKRLIFTLSKMNKSNNLLEEFDIEPTKSKKIVANFLVICKKEINRNKSALSRFLINTTHGDVRQALVYFKGFLTSGYTNINEMANEPNWKLQKHQVLKPMMIPDRYFYDERLSKIPNVYQLRNELLSSHFTGLRILYLLNSKSNDKAFSGFVDSKLLIQQFEDMYDLKIDCEKNIDVFLKLGLIEANNRLDYYSNEVDQVRITTFGKYMLEYLARDFTYLDLVSFDTGIYHQDLFNFFVDAANKELEYYYNRDFIKRIKSRLNRVQKFLEYLEKAEDYEFVIYNLKDDDKRFVPDFRMFFNQEKKIILASANKRKFIQGGKSLEMAT